MTRTQVNLMNIGGTLYGKDNKNLRKVAGQRQGTTEKEKGLDDQ